MSLPQRQKGRRSKTSAIVSACFHVVLVGTVSFLAARRVYQPPSEPPGGILVTNYPPENPQQTPNPPQVPPDFKPRPPSTSPTIPPQEPVPDIPVTTVPPPVEVPPPDTAPEMYIPAASVEMVDTNPTRRYIRIIQDAYLQVWDKPPGPDDANYAALIEVGVDSKGRIINPQFVKGSGDSTWDSAVKTAISRVKEVGVPPPDGFPSRFVVRFDTMSDIGPVQ